jgi:hypothetical protein
VVSEDSTVRADVKQMASRLQLAVGVPHIVVAVRSDYWSFENGAADVYRYADVGALPAEARWSAAPTVFCEVTQDSRGRRWRCCGPKERFGDYRPL